MILSDLVSNWAKEDPQRIAYIFQDKKITFFELEDKISRCAQGLSQLGIKKESTFGIILRNCPEFVILVMALSKLGAVAVPINFLEKPDRVALILNDAKAEGILTTKEFHRSSESAFKKVKTLKN